MVIAADDPLADVLAEPDELVPALELLLLLPPLLLHAARTPPESAVTAPSATAFLENQGRCALTPGSSFLIAQDSSESSFRRLREPTFEGYTGGLRAPRYKHDEMYATVTCAAFPEHCQQSFASETGARLEGLSILNVQFVAKKH